MSFTFEQPEKNSKEKSRLDKSDFLKKAKALLGPVLVGLAFAHNHVQAQTLGAPPLRLERNIKFLEKPGSQEVSSRMKGFENWFTLNQQEILQKSGSHLVERAFFCVRKPAEKFCTIQNYESHGVDVSPLEAGVIQRTLREGNEVISAHTHPPSDTFKGPSITDIENSFLLNKNYLREEDKKMFRQIIITEEGIWEYAINPAHPTLQKFLEIYGHIRESAEVAMEQLNKRLSLGQAYKDKEIVKKMWSIYGARYEEFDDLDFFNRMATAFNKVLDTNNPQDFITFAEANGITAQYQSFPKMEK